MKRVIFLDVDGVLNNANTQELSPKHLLGVDEENILMLQALVEMSNADIVLSSTWRFELDDNTQKNYEYLISRLAEHSIFISDMTGSRMGKRGLEIRKWLDEHPVDDYVILDDDCPGNFDEEEQSHLVNTTFVEGLTLEKAIDAYLILQGSQMKYILEN